MHLPILRFLTAVAVTALSLSLPLPAHAGPLPSLGGDDGLSVTAERTLGDTIAKQLFASPERLDDPLLDEYVQTLLQQLLRAARVRGELPEDLDERMAWRFVVLKNGTINAFALPGGYFGVHTGLIAKAARSDELAAVLAHEISHVTQRHISRLISADNKQSPWMAGAMVLGVLAASKSPQAANAILAGGQALSASNQLSFSRDMEREADRVGYGILTQAGFEGRGFIGLFEKLQDSQKFAAEAPSPFLRSHPVTTERIADMQSRYAGEPPQEKPSSSPVVALLMGARAEVLTDPGVEALQRLVAKAMQPLAASDQRTRDWYAGALAASKLRDYATAKKLHGWLEKDTSTGTAASRLVRLLGAELAIAARSREALEAYFDPADTSRAQLVLKTQRHLLAGTPAEALPALRGWVEQHPLDPAVLQLQSMTFAAANRPLDSLRVEAEYYESCFQTDKAIEVLAAWQERASRDSSVSEIDRAIVAVRLKALSQKKQ